MKNGHEHKI